MFKHHNTFRTLQGNYIEGANGHLDSQDIGWVCVYVVCLNQFHNSFFKKWRVPDLAQSEQILGVFNKYKEDFWKLMKQYVNAEDQSFNLLKHRHILRWNVPI